MHKDLWWYNGQEPDQHSLQYLINNRAFMYGDGFFESMLLKDGHIRHAEEHQQRLYRSAALLELHTDNIPTIHDLESLVLKHPGIQASKNYRIRLSVFRQDEGLYTPVGNTASWTIQLSEMAVAPQAHGLNVGIYTRQAKAKGPFSNIKSLSAQLYVMASMFAKEKGFDDVLVLNTSGNFIESSRCNLFLVVNGTVLTPPLAEGCIDGIYRNIVLHKADEMGIDFREQFISETELRLASEVWLSNAVRGLQWVREIDGTEYRRELFDKMVSFF